MRQRARRSRFSKRDVLFGSYGFVFTRIVWALILGSCICGQSQAQVSSFLTQKSADAAALDAVLEQKSNTPIIIEFAVPELPPLPSGDFSADGDFFGAVKTRIAVSQDAILQDHFGSAHAPRPGQGFSRTVQRMDITPMIAVNVTRAELEALAADPRITRIHQNKVNFPSLLQSVPAIGMPFIDGAFSRGATGGGRAVAIVDSGVLANHEFLAGRVIAEACYSTTFASEERTLCGSGNSTSESGPGAASAMAANCIAGTTNLCFHGTAVAGVAAGNNFNDIVSTWSSGEPYYGVAKNAQIVAVQTSVRRNLAADCAPKLAPCITTYDSDLVLALNWIAQNAVNLPNGVRLAAVNLSLGNGVPQSTFCDNHVLKASIDNLRALDIPTVISSGNDSSRTGVAAPACISTAYAVGSSFKHTTVADGGNIGPQVKGLAPGVNILTSDANSAGETSWYVPRTGTSLAAPHVAGAIAALKSACPTVSITGAGGIAERLFASGIPVHDTRSGGIYTRNYIIVQGIPDLLDCSVNPNTHDTSGDHKSDILWRSSEGNVAVWQMNGSQVLQSLPVGHPVTVSGWTIVGQRDFNFDHKSDMLWRGPDGTYYMWFLNGGRLMAAPFVAGPFPGWSVVSTADFNGDGNGDILWRDNNNGTLALYLMSGERVGASGVLGTVPISWSIAATADFDGDGRADILWRNSEGSVAIWFMDALSVKGTASVTNVHTSWSIVGTGDFGGNGRADIVWRNSNGDTAVWLMGGAFITSSAALGNVSMTWALAQTGDFDGDGRSDLLWRHSSGAVAIWFMNGTSVRSSAGLGNVPTNWAVQNANAN